MRPVQSCAVSLLGASLLCFACTEATTGSAPAPVSATPTAGAPPRTASSAPENAQQSLALEKLTGQSAADRLVGQRQLEATRLPGKPEVWVSLGHAWITTARESGDPGFHLNAGACAEHALALAPGDVLATALRGMVLLNDHRFAEARDLARAALARDPDSTQALGVLADATLELGDFQATVEATQRMVDLKPDLPSYGRVSYLKWLQGDREGALRAARSAHDAGRGSPDPEPSAWTLVQAALIFWHEGDYDGAAAGVELALQTLPGFAPALQTLGRVELSRGRAKEAIPHLEASLAKSPLCETAWLLSNARRAAGDPTGADTALAEAIRLGRQADPRTLSQLYSARGVEAVAALELAQHEAKTRGGPYTDDTLAWALHRAGRPAEARTASARAIALGTPDARLLFHHGAILLAAGDPAGRAFVERALALNPGFDLDGAAEARRLLTGPTSTK